jgi:hypothetical protein
MGTSNLLSLLFEINADPSKAEAALSNFEAASGKTFQASAAQIKPFDDALLNNTQSVRLLASEFGVHLPRQVSSAIAQMLPEIAGLGTALLGVFAIEEAVKFVGWVNKVAGAFNEVTESEKALKKVGDENLSAMEAMGRKSEQYARSQLNLLNAQIVAGEQHVQWLKDEADGLHEVNPIIREIVRDYNFWTGRSKELKEAESGVNAELAMRDAMIQVIGKDEEETHKKAAAGAKHAAEAAKHAAEEANRRAHQEAEFIIRVTEEGDRSTKRIQKWHEEWLKSIGMPEELKFSLAEINRQLNQNGLAAAKALPPLTALGGGFRQLTEAERALLPLGNQIDNQLLRQAQRVHEIVMEIQMEEVPARRRIQLEYQRQIDAANREIAHERYEYQQHKITRAQMEADEQAYTQMVLELAQQREEAAKRETVNQAESLAQSVAGLLGRLGLRKAEAIVEASVEVAKGFGCLGERDFWGAAQHFISAAEWGVVAGQATRHGAGGGGGGTLSRSAAGYGGGGGRSGGAGGQNE